MQCVHGRGIGYCMRAVRNWPSCPLALSAYQLGSAAARLLVTSSQVVKLLLNIVSS